MRRVRPFDLLLSFFATDHDHVHELLLSLPVSRALYPGISTFLPRHKGDQLGKGSTRFFLARPDDPNCLVCIIYKYARAARLRAGAPFFVSPYRTISADEVKNLVKFTAIACGVPAERATLHSLRIGGLVQMFAAGVSIEVCQLAGRWASTKSLIPYMRSSMEAFQQVSTVLNDPNLVTPEHVRRLYVQ